MYYTTVNNFEVRKIKNKKYINTFIQQGHIKLVSCDSKDIYKMLQI